MCSPLPRRRRLAPAAQGGDPTERSELRRSAPLLPAKRQEYLEAEVSSDIARHVAPGRAGSVLSAVPHEDPQADLQRGPKPTTKFQKEVDKGISKEFDTEFCSWPSRRTFSVWKQGFKASAWDSGGWCCCYGCLPSRLHRPSV